MFPERLRRATLLVAAVAALGLAEQSSDPSPILANLPGAQFPGSGWMSIWVLWNLAASFMCVVAFVTWPDSPKLLRLAAVVFAGAIWARSSALFIEYGFDLWGTVTRNVLTSLLIIGSWSWSGETLRRLEAARRE